MSKELQPNQLWEELKNNYNGNTLEQLMTESGGSGFITNIKEFFSNALLKIIGSVNDLFKTYNITDKYYKDNVRDLTKLNGKISNISKLQFSTISSMKMKCVTGMKLDYLSTTKELKQFIPMINNLKNEIDKVSTFIENLINNNNDIRQSGSRKIDTDNLLFMANKTTAIIEELIDGKSPVDEKTINMLFPNVVSFKMVKDDLLSINNDLLKANIEDINKSVKRLITVTETWLKNSREEKDVVYNSNTINQLQYGVESIAKITTSFGMFLILSNQFTSYFMSTVEIVESTKQ